MTPVTDLYTGMWFYPSIWGRNSVWGRGGYVRFQLETSSGMTSATEVNR